ncbi:MAG: orotidine-5-phosphate decarboxylase [Bacteroidota bacterium]|jgi:orotidine-5'-phosphate decarboxylase
MTRAELIEQIKRKKSFLCVGLDPDLSKIPPHLLKEDDPIFAFNKAIIDATHDLAVAYKPNTAFYECHGSKGWETLQKTIEYMPKDVFCIADAKRGDIGNTSTYYAKTFFENMNCDAVTVAPYMGEDSVKPFLAFENKWVILLALTSNKGAFDFQFMESKENKPLYQQVIETSQSWGTDSNLMYVIGATKTEQLAHIRLIAPNHFFLVPGVGAQGGSLDEVVQFGWSDDCGLLINSSRAILYASSNEHFADAAREEALSLQKEMEIIVNKKGFIFQ